MAPSATPTTAPADRTAATPTTAHNACLATTRTTATTATPTTAPADGTAMARPDGNHTHNGALAAMPTSAPTDGQPLQKRTNLPGFCEMEPEWFNFFDSVRHGGDECPARFMVVLERSETNELDKCANFFWGGWSELQP
jgi:hypothetical protein